MSYEAIGEAKAIYHNFGKNKTALKKLAKVDNESPHRKRMGY